MYGHESEPKYLQFSKLAYRIGVLYQRLAPGTFRNALFAFARKPVHDSFASNASNSA